PDTTLFRSVKGSMPGHLPTRTFWPISKKVIGLTKTLSACSIRVIALLDKRESPVSVHAQVWVSRRTDFTRYLPREPIRPHSLVPGNQAPRLQADFCGNPQ